LSAQFITVGQKLIDGSAGRGTKALFLPPPNSNDAAVHSLAENLFWMDIIGEHAALISMLMPGPPLESQRTRADEFQRVFSAQFERAHAVMLDQTNYASLNRSTIDAIKPFIDFEHSLLDAQTSGTIHTMIWPAFYEHTIHEAEHAILRLEKLATGATALDPKEVIGFWAGMMSDHGEFLAHLLDPREADLISTALDSAAQFKGFQESAQSKDLRGGDVMAAVQELIDFEAATETGVQMGTIRSVIPPLLADHVRRESLKLVDELKRSGYGN
jgi:hypothetical protein